MTSGKLDAESNLDANRPTSAEEVGRRFEAAIGLFRTKKEAADTLDMSTDQLNRYIKGSASPPLSVLSRLAEAKDVRLDWLATGEGPMCRGQAVLAPADGEIGVGEGDETLMQRVIEATWEWFYKRNGNLNTLSGKEMSMCVVAVYRLVRRQRDAMSPPPSIDEYAKMAKANLDDIAGMIK